jgi:hypothetical protein
MIGPVMRLISAVTVITDWRAMSATSHSASPADGGFGSCPEGTVNRKEAVVSG